MPRVTFDQVLTIYRCTTFDAVGDEGTLSIDSSVVLDSLRTIESDEQAGDDANLAALAGQTDLAVGAKVRIRIGAPRLALGLLVRKFDDLLNGPEARLLEPKAYFIIENSVERGTTPPPAIVSRYRSVLGVVTLFAEAASYLDRTRQELVFFRSGKFVVPVIYDAAAIQRSDPVATAKLLELFAGEIHRDQKLAILAEAIAHTCESQPLATRFSYLLDNVRAVTEEVQNGYRLYASSFSYAKIRGDVEAAKLDYVTKIHRTLIDIQGQLLGVPVATIIVASQLKLAKECGLEFWTNIAVLAGAWIFLGLFSIAVINQWFTLSSISGEVERQRKKLQADYAAISAQFVDIFDGLSGRISWHRAALIGVGLIALVGAIVASVAFTRLTLVSPKVCFVSPQNEMPSTENSQTSSPSGSTTTSPSSLGDVSK